MDNKGLNNRKGLHLKVDTSKPKAVIPKKSESLHRSMPDDDVLINYNKKLPNAMLSKSTRMQADAHMAIKQLSVVENKPMYVVINEMVENYMQSVPASSRRLVLPYVRSVQKNMKKEDEL